MVYLSIYLFNFSFLGIQKTIICKVYNMVLALNSLKNLDVIGGCYNIIILSTPAIILFIL